MAVSYSSKKCDSCGGSLEYIKEKKVWRCKYCGQELVREEQYDGLFTIKNVVRQTIIDTAYRRLQKARENLSECEKIDSKYVGTMIARICCRMISVITPGACSPEEMRGSFQRLKDDYTQLKEKDSGIGEDEEVLYGFLDSADAYAVLILVFDTLGDVQRTELLLKMLEPGKVYSKECNKDLLTYFLKNQQMEIADAILSNTNNLDLHSSLDIVLEKCPDVPEKAGMVQKLLEQGAYNSQDRSRMQTYICGEDSCGTKAAVLHACKGLNLLPDMEYIVQYVLSQTDAGQTACALEGICDGNLRDSELYYLLEYALTAEAEKACVILEKIENSGQFAILNAKQLGRHFLDSDRPAEERLKIWEKLQLFRLENKAAELVFTRYLCDGEDTPDSREKILTALLAFVDVITPTGLMQYLNTCTLDQENKPQIVQAIFTRPEMKPAYFSDALSQYIRKSPDAPEVQKEVISSLIQAGLTMDAGGINEYICGPKDSPSEKVELLRQLEQNGSCPRPDSLSLYLEKCEDVYSEELFAYLWKHSSVISEKALANYVLYCASGAPAKAQNAAELSKKRGAAFGAGSCEITHLQHKIFCNLAQAYLLITQDAAETASALLQSMAAQTKLTSDIRVDGNVVRFKKYLKENRSALSPLTVRLCEEHRLFSLF